MNKIVLVFYIIGIILLSLFMGKTEIHLLPFSFKMWNWYYVILWFIAGVSLTIVNK